GENNSARKSPVGNRWRQRSIACCGRLEMSLWTRMANVFQEAQVNREIDDELEAHVAEAMASGRDAEEARRALGSPLRHREESRDARLVRWLADFTQDVRFAL